jgi:D-tyrosyl-tRNA(Tyr) deacylase
MRVLLQKVTEARVRVDNETVGEIAHGYCLFVGITHDDTREQADWLANKIVSLRLFGGADSFMEQNIQDVQGSLLVVSQFTLYGEVAKGTRPSFTAAARPEPAKELFEHFVEVCRQLELPVATGVFGAHMEVALTNDGPITILLEK